jgi:hypothetical protein
MKKSGAIFCMFALATGCLALLLLVCPVAGRAGAAEGVHASAPAAEDENQGKSVTELNKELTNPVSNIWSLVIQQNNFHLDRPDRWQSNLQFQPVMPLALTKDWNLITRPVFQLYNSTPYPHAYRPKGSLKPRVEYPRTTGLGDTIVAEMFSPGPSLVGNWLLGIGPTFIFPTATSKYTGQEKWQAGPAAVVGYLSHKWILGAFVQNWSSFAGDKHRESTNQMNLQPIAAYFLEDGWSVGYSGNILANWEVEKDNRWTVPVGLAVNKVVKFGRLPVKLGLAVQYMPIRPDDFGQMWNLQLTVTPVIPKLIKGVLFDF